MLKLSELCIACVLALLSLAGIPLLEMWLTQYASPQSGVWFWIGAIKFVLWSYIILFIAYFLFTTICQTATKE